MHRLLAEILCTVPLWLPQCLLPSIFRVNEKVLHPGLCLCFLTKVRSASGRLGAVHSMLKLEEMVIWIIEVRVDNEVRRKRCVPVIRVMVKHIQTRSPLIGKLASDSRFFNYNCNLRNMTKRSSCRWHWATQRIAGRPPATLLPCLTTPRDDTVLRCLFVFQRLVLPLQYLKFSFNIHRDRRQILR